MFCRMIPVERKNVGIISRNFKSSYHLITIIKEDAKFNLYAFNYSAPSRI